jgi:hypothetical protein
MEKDDTRATAGRRPETRYLVYAEHMIFGSTRGELLPDERSVWQDFMSMAALTGNRIDYTFPDLLAKKLNIPAELLERSVEKCIKYHKIRFKVKKSENKTYIYLIKWKVYQPAYLWESPEKSTRRKRIAKDPESEAHVSSKGKESKVKENIKSGSPTSEAHYNTQFEFLKRLRIIEEELEQETDNSRNERLFDFILKRYRSLDPIRELDAIRELFKKNPGEVRTRIKAGTSLTDQLYALFENAARYAGLKADGKK